LAGKNAGSFITVSEEKDSYNNSSGDLGIAEEYVVTAHNNQVYEFSFMASAKVFGTQRVTEIRKHMFDSIKWLN
jgi:hypothetical protein